MQKQLEKIVQSIFRFLRISKISYKLGFILVTSIIIPMTIFAFLSLSISSKADFQAVSRGNQKVALRAAEQINQRITNSIHILQSVLENINGLHLSNSQKEIVIKNHVLNFKEFDKIIITNRHGQEVVTSEMGGELKDRSDDDAFTTASQNRIYFSDIFISDDFIPTMTIALPSFLLGEFDGAIIGKINLLNMWRMVDSLTIGKKGYAHVVSKKGLLIAHGEGDSKPGIIGNEDLSHLQIVQEVLTGNASIMEYKNRKGIMVLGTAAPVKTVNWGLIIEQPLSEAYAPTYKMGKRLIILGLVILLIMSFIAYMGVNSSVIRPLKKLIGGIDEKDLSFEKGDEFSNLAKFYNFMSKSVAELEKGLEKYSESAGLGKLSAGFIHDLKHPIDNVIRVTRHLVKHIKDKELQKFSRELLNEETKNINRLILKVKESKVDYTPSSVQISVNQVLSDLCRLFQKKLDENKITLIKEFSHCDMFINGDRFDLERVIKNLIVNATEAMEGGGTLTLSSKKENSRIIVSISDTGHGIEPKRLKTLFTESCSGKEKGWGIGLSVSKELVEKMDGTIEGKSLSGQGATFTIKFKSV